MITKELWRKIVYGTRDERVYLVKRSLEAFALYYFSEYFDYPIPQFHSDFYADFQSIAKNELTEAAWIAFAESAKTTIAKVGVQWLIAGQHRRYINWDSYDISNPENALFDIIVSLQTNEKLRADFGDLYIEKRSNEQKTLKRVSRFITTNKIKVEAFSTGTSPRGRLYGKYRPDFFIFDDIENVITRRSVRITKNIIDHYNEVKRGMSTDAGILILGNYISETGVIQHVMDRVMSNPRGIVRNIPVVDPVTSEIAWRSKYVATDEEAVSLNRNIPNPKQYVVSLQSKRRDLGEATYRENMLNDPAGAAEPFFDRRKLDEDLKKCADPLEVSGGLYIYARYNPAHRYAIGGDTSMGIGLDSNASVIEDFSRTPNLIVGTYTNNQITPDVFAHELKRQGNMYGDCLIAPESNGESGGTCVNALKAIYRKVYQTRAATQMYDKATNKVGWRTTSASKPEMLFKFKSDYEDGRLEIRDKRLLLEMRSFTSLNMSENVSPLDTTKHFDLLMAACIANMMRTYATYTKPKKVFIQQPYESPSIEQESRRIEITPRRYQQAPYESAGL